VINLPPNSPNAFTFTGVADKAKYNVVIKSPGTNVMNIISIIQKITGEGVEKQVSN
jgi:hypothetical protein